jgi:hypothetical protein
MSGNTSPKLSERTYAFFNFASDIRRESHRLVGRNREGLFFDFIPNCAMDPLGIASRGRKQVDDQDVDASVQKLDCLFDESPQCMAATLVARRDDFHHADDPAERMTNDDSIGECCRSLSGGFNAQPLGGRGRRQHGATGTTCGRLGMTAPLECQDIRCNPSSVLLDKGRIAGRQQTAIERIADGDGPRLMKIVEQIGINAGPVMNRHSKLPAGDALSPKIILRCHPARYSSSPLSFASTL